jgi:superfamily I DNA/RNA helicase
VVFGEIERLLGSASGSAADVSLLEAPVRVVVPSKSLRLHVASALLRSRGRAVLGVEVATLHAVAAQVLHRAGEPLPAGEALFGVLARRFAREVPALAEGLDDLVDGYGAVASTVRDFLDAGFDPGLTDGVVQAATEAARADGRRIGTAAERDRAAALAHLCAAVERGMASLGVGRTTHLYRRAAELLAASPELLPARAVLVHGFGDATAVAADLLEALLARPGSLLVLDRPPDPASPADPDALERTFTERLAARMDGVVETLEGPGPAPEPARLSAFAAPGAAAEARELARRVRALLDREDDPVAPEEIGVVVRELRPDQPYTTALRRAFERSGIPFSAVGAAGPLLPAGRRLLALQELLRRRDATPTSRWLDALEAPPGLEAGGAPRHLLFELRLAFHTLGAGRLGEVAALDPLRFGTEGFPLPIRQGLEAIEGAEGEATEGDGEPGGVAPRRRVPSESLREAAGAARRLVARLESWPARARLAEHLRRLRELLAEDLGWPRPGDRRAGDAADPWTQLWASLDTLEREIPGALELSYDELFLLLDRARERDPRGGGRDALGGSGGGIAVLGALEARGRTFGHLFVAGLNRGTFPRTIQEDPLLPDDLRRALHVVLPELPVKLAGFDEERYLFAQLLAAAPEVTLSWRTATEEGQPLPVSPLVERLALSRDELRDELRGAGEAAAARDREEAAEPRPPLEHAVAAALAGDRDRFTALLAVALAETQPHLDERGARALATAHRAVLDEMDPDLATPEGRAVRATLGPYYGFVGPPAAGDPRLGPLFVTALEDLSACPWQTFLRRLLRLEPTPDPLEALPSLDALLVGSLVHAVLEEVVRRALPAADGERPTLADVLGAAAGAGGGALVDLSGEPVEEAGEGAVTPPAREPVAVAWPAPEALEAIFHRQARRLLEAEGIALPGLARALEAAARPFVDAARDADWSEASVPVLAAEVEGAVEVADAAGRQRTLRFRADRVDAVPGRRKPTFRLTDYKTGKPISTAKKETTRRDHFLRQVEAGRRLQAVAYALAASGRLPWQPDAIGRYLFLRRGIEPEYRELAAWSSAVPFAEAFAAAVRTGLAAWDRGAFFPRLVEPDKDEEPALCRYCEVREACLRGDSGARRRLATWAESRRQTRLDVGILSPTASEAALLGVWRLRSKEPS